VPWWGWMLIGVGISGVVVLGVWLLLPLRRKEPAVDRAGILESEKLRLAEEREAERRGREAAEAVARELEAEIRSIADLKRRKLEELDARESKTFRELGDDPDAILTRLDGILGKVGSGDVGPDKP